MPPRTRPFWRLATLVAVLLLVAAGCGDDDEPTAGGGRETVKIAFVGALTGDSANLGINMRNGARVAVDEANEEGGDVIVELDDSFDTQGDAAQATTLKDRYIADESIVAVVGPAFSGETKAVLPSLDEAGLVMISPSATNAGLPTIVPGTKVFHRLVPDDDIQGQGVADYVSRKLKARRAAYVHDNTEYGKALAETSATLWEKAGVETAVTDTVDPKSQDFSAAVNNVRAADPDVVFYGGYYTEAGRLKKQLADAGVRATFVSGDGALDPGFVKAAGTGADGAQITCACNLATADAEGKLGEFARRYREIHGTDPGTYATEGYDAAKILIEGIKQGHTDRASLLDYVESLGAYEGLSKRIEFEDNGNIKASGVFVFEIRGRKIELLGTTDELVGKGT